MDVINEQVLWGIIYNWLKVDHGVRRREVADPSFELEVTG